MEQENDLLVCGDCQTTFALQEIVQFIKHKNHSCKTECNGEGSVDDEPRKDDDDLPKDLSAKRSRLESIEVEDTLVDRDSVTTSYPFSVNINLPSAKKFDNRIPLKPRQVVDAEANTTLTGMISFSSEIILNTQFFLSPLGSKHI